MKLGLVPHSQPVLPVEKFVAFLSQIPPRGPFLPVAPVYNCHAVNNLPFWELHGMEEVIGSIPIRSTKTFRIQSAARREQVPPIRSCIQETAEALIEFQRHAAQQFAQEPSGCRRAFVVRSLDLNAERLPIWTTDLRRAR